MRTGCEKAPVRLSIMTRMVFARSDLRIFRDAKLAGVEDFLGILQLGLKFGSADRL